MTLITAVFRVTEENVHIRLKESETRKTSVWVGWIGAGWSWWLNSRPKSKTATCLDTKGATIGPTFPCDFAKY